MAQAGGSMLYARIVHCVGQSLLSWAFRNKLDKLHRYKLERGSGCLKGQMAKTP